MKKFQLFFSFLFISNFVFAQWQVRDSSLFNPHVTVGYGYSTPGGDLANRFGNNGSIEVGFHIKDKKNWYYGVQFNYLFGNKVHEPNLLSNLLTSRGEILDEQGQIATMFIQERGFNLFLQGGKLFPVIGPNKNSGLLITGGVGLIQHKIRIEHQEAKITQLEGEYLKGYDRLTNGLSVNQFIGYYHLSNNRLINFYIGAQATEGFTQSRREWNLDTQTQDNSKRLDMLFGLRAGWILNLYQRAPNDYYIY
jgi:hypothetical protein